MSQSDGAPGSETQPAERLFAVPSGRQVLPGRAAIAGKLPWRAAADGRTVFRRGAPLVLWWGWVAFVIFNVVDVVIPGRDYFSLELTAGLLAVTAVMYSCALRPKVVADDNGIRVCNPYRDHLVRWGAVNGVRLGDSLELTCARPGPKKDKVIYCWALYSGRRSRLRAQLRADRQQARLPGRTAAEIGSLSRPDPVTLMAEELGRRSVAARQAGASSAMLESRWAWLSVACLLVPAVMLLALILAG